MVEVASPGFGDWWDVKTQGAEASRATPTVLLGRLSCGNHSVEAGTQEECHRLQVLGPPRNRPSKFPRQDFIPGLYSNTRDAALEGEFSGWFPRVCLVFLARVTGIYTSYVSVMTCAGSTGAVRKQVSTHTAGSQNGRKVPSWVGILVL